jgi:hypothetical protein
VRVYVIAILLGACATAGPPAAGPAEPTSTSPSTAPRKEGEPEIVHVGKSYKLTHAAATARYAKGERCGGGDAPESQIGEPDQRNEMQIGRERVITYGFRFPEGMLLIRCRADHVETTRTLK